MRVTIIVEDNRVNVEGFSETVDCSSLGNDVHVVQWYGTYGELEYYNGPGAKKIRGNTPLADFEPFQYLVDAWEVEAKKLIKVAVPNAS